MNLSHFNDCIWITEIPRPNDTVKQFQWDNRKTYTHWEGFNAVPPDTKGDYIPTKGDKLFFFQGCNCPRFKVRPWAEKFGGSITIRAGS